MSDYLDGGLNTKVHGLTAPENYADFDTEYYNLMEAVDEGLILVKQTEADLPSNVPADVFAFVKGTQSFYASNGSSFDQMDVSVDFSNLTVEEINNLVDELDEHFLKLSGGVMEGDIDMDNYDIYSAGTLEANDELILPVK